MSNFIYQRVIERKKTNKKQYTINTEIQSTIDMQDYQAVTCV